MELTQRQQGILNGMLLGDAYLQPTGSNNARLRLEHSLKQQAYVNWKYEELISLFPSEPALLERIHPESRRMYQYLRLQSYASPVFGMLRRKFYDAEGKKILPLELEEILASSLTIAVWYMDDGYYDKRDKSAHIYLQAFATQEITRLINAFGEIYGIECKAYCRPDRNACQLNFRNSNKDALVSLVKPHLIESMRYKIPLDPVTTEPAKVR